MKNRNIILRNTPRHGDISIFFYNHESEILGKSDLDLHDFFGGLFAISDFKKDLIYQGAVSDCNLYKEKIKILHSRCSYLQNVIIKKAR